MFHLSTKTAARLVCCECYLEQKGPESVCQEEVKNPLLDPSIQCAECFIHHLDIL